MLPPDSTGPSLVARPEGPAPGAASRARPLIQIVHTTPGVHDRLASDAGTTIERLDDTALLELLDGIGRPAGLIEIEGRVRLTADITDPLGRARNRPDGTG